MGVFLNSSIIFGENWFMQVFLSLCINSFHISHFRKSSEAGFTQVFKIWANKKKDKVRTTKITILGTCCWVIEHRHGETQELRPGQSVTPSIAYIRKLKTKKC